MDKHPLNGMAIQSPAFSTRDVRKAPQLPQCKTLAKPHHLLAFG